MLKRGACGGVVHVPGSTSNVWGSMAETWRIQFKRSTCPFRGNHKVHLMEFDAFCLRLLATIYYSSVSHLPVTCPFC